MSDLKIISKSLRAAVDAGDLGAIAECVAALERFASGEKSPTYVLVNEHFAKMPFGPLGMAVLDFEGLFETVEEALAARGKARRDHGNPNICIYELVKTPAEQEAEDGWDDDRDRSEHKEKEGNNLTIEIQGNGDHDLDLPLQEVSRLVADGFTSGFDSNETGTFRFSVNNATSGFIKRRMLDVNHEDLQDPD
jgi:hypothetical protein